MDTVRVAVPTSPARAAPAPYRCVEPVDAGDDRYRRECELLARHLHDAHPEVPLATVHDLVVDASDALEGAKVLTYRLILVERAVRRRLAAVPRSTPPAERNDDR